MSPHSDAVVTTAFNQLTTGVLPGGGRTIDDLVEDLLRPMLRNWLDTNLPQMVERLVREEIERVSRGRR
jgi:cell pole-organizing protein PopZ